MQGAYQPPRRGDTDTAPLRFMDIEGDRAWLPAGWEQLVLAYGFSGHGFKPAPAVGRVLARAVLGGTPGVDIAAYHHGRFEDGAPITEARVLRQDVRADGIRSQQVANDSVFTAKRSALVKEADRCCGRTLFGRNRS